MSAKKWVRWGGVIGVAVVLAGGWWLYKSAPKMGAGAIAVCLQTDALAASAEAPAGMVWIPGGEFTMGTNDGYPEEGPAREVAVSGFWIDVHEVTNAEFARFVAATGYVTVAERAPDPADYPGVPAAELVAGSAVFVPPTDFSGGANPLSWWRYMPGAEWRAPEGPKSDIAGRDHYPVVHIAYDDALAYAKWAGRSLPTEEQWEYAARGGAPATRYAWGDEYAPDGQHRANTWQGIFPVQNSAEDGFVGTAPVGCFPPNGYGLYDMIGNVWEWTTSGYTASHAALPVADAPERVIKGGSFLCAANYCLRYRPAARHAQEVGLGTDHIGFRTVLNPEPPE